MKKLAAVVIIHNPLCNVLNNIKSYYKFVDKVFIIDNSEKSNYETYKDFKKTEYILNKENIGVASALNMAVKKATEEGYQWLLTMDQDSCFKKDSLGKMIEKLDSKSKVAIYAPKYIMDNNFKKFPNIVITSGNILNLDICNKLGGFKDWLFIDGVDHEYCLNVLKNKFKIMTVTSAKLMHNLGNTKSVKIVNKKIYNTNHNNIRRYFITRNRLYINSMYKDIYPDFCRSELKNTRRETIKIILFERNKISKLKYISRGKKDFKNGVKGYPQFLKDKKKINYHIDEYWCDMNKQVLYLRGWAYLDNYTINIIGDDKDIFISKPNVMRMDINKYFSTTSDKNKYGFEYVVELTKKYKNIKIHLSYDGKSKKILADGGFESKTKRALRKFKRLCEKALRVIKKQKFNLFRIRVIKNYLSIVRDIISSKKNNTEYINPNNSFEYRNYVEKKLDEDIDIKYRPLISILVPVYNVPIVYLRECIESVLKQTYNNWELCIADDCSTNPEIKQVLEEYVKRDNRIKVVYRVKNGHISQCTNSALELATGEFISLLDNDDIITSDALMQVVRVLNKNNKLDLIYSDEDKLDLNNNKCFPAYKPDWSPDIFYCYNYICHFTTIRKTIIDEIGGFRTGYEGAQDYDLFLRTVAKTTDDKIYHIPKILYHWRMIPGSTAAELSNKGYAFERGKKALKDYMKNAGYNCHVDSVSSMPYYYPNYKVSEKTKILIIIDKVTSNSNLDKCLKTVTENMDYKNYTIVVNMKKHFRMGGFKYKSVQFINDKISNIIGNSDAELVVILNDQIQFVKETKICEMLRYAAQRHVGLVSGTITKNKNYINYSGTVLLNKSLKYANHGKTKKSFGYLGKLKLPTNYICPGLDVIVFEKKKYMEIDSEYDFDFNNIDSYLEFCFKFYNRNYYGVVLPNCIFTTFKAFKTETINYKNITIDRDCFYNDNLSKKYLYKLDR